MPGQLNLVSPFCSQKLNPLAYAPPALNQPQVHINVTALPSPVLNPIAAQLLSIQPAFRFAPPPTQPARSLNVNNPVANNANPLPCICFSQHLNYPAALEKRYMPLSCVLSTHAAISFSLSLSLSLQDSNVWRFPSAVPAITIPVVDTSVNLSNVSLAPFYSPHVRTSLRSSNRVQAAARSQSHLTSELMQPNLCHTNRSSIVWSYRSELLVLGWPKSSHAFGSFIGFRGFGKTVEGRNN